MSFSEILDLGSLDVCNSHQRTAFIHLGEKSDGSYPKSTLDFQLPESLQKHFPQSTTRLPIFLPMNGRKNFFPQYWEWEPTKDGKPYRVCIGEGGIDGLGMRLSKQDWKFHDRQCSGWDCPEVKEGKCKRTGIFSFYVDADHGETLNLYQIKTHSGHTFKKINAQVEGFKEIPMLNGDISFVPMWLSRLEKTVTDGENKKRKIHYLSLSLRLTAQEALSMRRSYVGMPIAAPPMAKTPDTPPPKTEPKKEPPAETGPETSPPSDKEQSKASPAEKQKPGNKKEPVRTPQEKDFIEKALNAEERIKGLGSEKATIELNDCKGAYESPAELLDAMDIGGLITYTNQIISIWNKRKSFDDRKEGSDDVPF